MNLRKHAFITDGTFEFRECGEWQRWSFDPKTWRTADGLFARLWSENRAIWVLSEETARWLRAALSGPVEQFHVTRNSIREIDEEENRICRSGGDEGREMSERISFKPKSAPEGTRDCCILFPDKAQNWEIDADDNPEVIERAFTRLQEHFGRSLVYPPGRLAIYLMEGARERAKEQVDYKRKPSSLGPWSELGDLDWKRTREFTGVEKQAKYIHAFDKKAAFLQAVGIPLGLGEYRRWEGPIEIELPLDNLPGLWLVRSMSYLNAREDFAAPGFRGAEVFPQWVATPTLQLLAKLGLLTEIKEAYVATEAHKLFPTYQSRIRRAIAEAESEMAVAASDDDERFEAARMMKRFIKAIYVKGIGYLHADFAKGEWFHRPDWWSTIVAEASARIFRDAMDVYVGAGALPVAVYIDCLYYVSNERDPYKAFPMFASERFANKYKHKGTALLTREMINAHRDGVAPGSFGGMFKRAVEKFQGGEA